MKIYVTNLLLHHSSAKNNSERADDYLLIIIIRFMLIAWLVMKVMSWKLWLANRTFPLVPLVPLPQSLHVILFALFFAFAVVLFIKPGQPVLLSFLLLTETISLAGDQLRWHPWEYQFLFICLAVILCGKHSKYAINSILFIFASSYFFSGISKINGDFLNNIWLRLMLVKVLHAPKAVYYSRVVRYAGLLIPLIEITCSVLVLLLKHFKMTAWLPICVHLFIIAYVSPLLSNYDYIVLPWNIFMMSTVYLLFVKHKTVFSFDWLYKQNKVIAFSWIVFPLAGMFGYWPPFFSFKLYAGIPVAMVVYIPAATNVPPEIMPFMRYSKKGYQGLHNYFRPFDWCNDELAVPIPPEKKIYESLQHSFEEKYKELHPVFRYD